ASILGTFGGLESISLYTRDWPYCRVFSARINIKDLLGGYFFLEEDPLKTVDLMEEIILQKRKALGWKTD
ncbi:hypothetical protein HNQ76_001371, partial [Thermosulfuriphilus ammonigenes]|nr:hypothetical protein [Thermosulfuriphilus ammonigenes]